MATKTPIDLDTLSVQEITALIAAAEEKRGAKLEEAKQALQSEMRAKATALGISLEDLIGKPAGGAAPRKGRNASGSTLAAKYRGPNGEEWTGRGRLPKWLVAMEAEGRKRDEFLIR